MNASEPTPDSDFTQLVSYARNVGANVVSRQIGARSKTAGLRLRGAASAILEAGEDLKKPGRAEWIGELCEYAATYVDRAGVYLETSSTDALGHDFDRFARKQPVVVAGAILASGFALARILRVSALPRNGYRSAAGAS